MNMEFRPGFDDVFVAGKEQESLEDKIIDYDKAINSLEVVQAAMGYSEDIQDQIDILNEKRMRVYENLRGFDTLFIKILKCNLLL